MGTLFSLSVLLSVVSAPFNIFAEERRDASINTNVYTQQENQVTKLGPEERVVTITKKNPVVIDSSSLSFHAIGQFDITAYSSTTDQTDDSPFIMANGKLVHDGAIATNFLPFGTKVRLPELFGNKVFTVEDKMNRRFQDRMDIWMETRSEALNFGRKFTTVEVSR